MIARPLLKYACSFDDETATFRYRGRAYEGLAAPEELRALVPLLNGRAGLREIGAASGLDPDVVADAVGRLADVPLVVDGAEVLRDDGLLSGAELFWRLERLLFEWRYGGTRIADCERLEREIAAGDAPLDVVKGYCIEISHQLANTPTEIAVAIANAPTPAMREHFMEFYEEEYEHGGMLNDALASWLPREALRDAAPLPQTLGLLNTYNWWAQKDVLLYAVALMRDEQSVLDAEIPPERDIAGGIVAHYDVPDDVAAFFRWHANFDREEAHGFFPEKVFREVPVVDDARAARLVNALRLIIDLYDAWFEAIRAYYGAHPVESRWNLREQAMVESPPRALARV